MGLSLSILRCMFVTGLYYDPPGRFADVISCGGRLLVNPIARLFLFGFGMILVFVANKKEKNL